MNVFNEMTEKELMLSQLNRSFVESISQPSKLMGNEVDMLCLGRELVLGLPTES
jgi:hypothetical protein